jgi:hypothetical protein
MPPTGNMDQAASAPFPTDLPGNDETLKAENRKRKSSRRRFEFALADRGS